MTASSNNGQPVTAAPLAKFSHVAQVHVEAVLIKQVWRHMPGGLCARVLRRTKPDSRCSARSLESAALHVRPWGVEAPGVQIRLWVLDHQVGFSGLLPAAAGARRQHAPTAVGAGQQRLAAGASLAGGGAASRPAAARPWQTRVVGSHDDEQPVQEDGSISTQKCIRWPWAAPITQQ
jgi:hypothetical protein